LPPRASFQEAKVETFLRLLTQVRSKRDGQSLRFWRNQRCIFYWKRGGIYLLLEAGYASENYILQSVELNQQFWNLASKIPNVLTRNRSITVLRRFAQGQFTYRQVSESGKILGELSLGQQSVGKLSLGEPS